MLNKIFSKDYFSERPLIVATGLAILSMAVTLFRVMTTVTPQDFKIATSYTQYGADSFILGDWYSLYEFAAFAVISTLGAILLSARLLNIDKNLAYTTIILQHVVLVFLFIVSGALLEASAIAT